MSSRRRSGSRRPKRDGADGGKGEGSDDKRGAGEGEGEGEGRAGKRGGGGKRRGAGKPGAGGKGGGKRGKLPRAQEISAGGVVLRGEQVVVIVPTRRAPDGSRVLALPKGHVDPGENTLQAAEREVREEAGVSVELVRELGEVRYWYRRDGRTIPKSVTFYLFSYLSGDTADHDDEVEEARWIDLREARTALTHAAEREMIERALAYLREDR
jgi:8-oxo-dGTP pyrophosphatase MutT (NUDIX family)